MSRYRDIYFLTITYIKLKIIVKKRAELMYKILIIEDDITIREELAIVLRNNGYETYSIKDFFSIINNVKDIIPDLILLDINLPYIDGFRLCSQIRSFSKVPIIFVTSRNTDMDELQCITLGGDDFITKPYNTSILLARISSLLRRVYPKETTQILTHKGVNLNIESSKIEHKDSWIELTKNEVKILIFLFRNKEKIIPRVDIIEYLWDNQLFIDDNTLSVNITRIRNKLEGIGVTDFIITKHRQGYMI